ncbi:MAG: sulfatase [Gammaproteobacteria bacterium]|nr:sulfatase [Gammaproteobacteria bacterium]
MNTVLRGLPLLALGLVPGVVSAMAGCEAEPPAAIEVKTPSTGDQRPPNIVLILGDDLGYGDIGVYGSEIIKTPSIDALASEGIRFTQGYVSHPVCSPSRAGLMTGRYQQRHGWEFNPAGRDASAGMRVEERTLADALKSLGYVTGMVGKWHLGHQRPHHPMSRGFDEYFGVLEGGSIFIDSRVAGVEYGSIRGEAGPTERPNKVLRGFDEVKVGKYLTDAFTDEAVDFVTRHKDEPFFLYLSHTTPHTPLQATARYLEGYRHVTDQRTRVYAAMVASLDESVRRVVAAIKEIGQYDNTLIVFTSDNGCAGYIHGACSNSPLRGFKRYHHEGGVRVPFIVSWPARLPSGEIFSAPVITLDLLATFTAAAGKAVTTEDSVNLLPYLRGEQSGVPHQYLYWRSGPTLAIRDDRWKLIKYNRTDFRPADLNETGRLTPPAGGWPTDSPLGQVTLLYDLNEDIGELRNLANDHPQVVERLEQQLDRWRQDLVDPIQPPIRSTLTEIDAEWVQLLF